MIECKNEIEKYELKFHIHNGDDLRHWSCQGSLLEVIMAIYESSDLTEVVCILKIVGQKLSEYRAI